jgi:hypothetical protein
MALQHLRSSTAHKRPIPTVMSAGQIAINTNEASPALFFKDSNGDLVKVGPVHIGENAPNSSPASVAATALVTGTVYQILTVGTTDFTLVGASANTVGTIFTATGTTTGTGTVSGQQGVEKGEMWLDTTGGTYVLKIYDGSAWRSESGTFVDSAGDTMTGALLLDNAASASAPDLSFDGDADTGVYSPGANQVAIATGGNGRVLISNVGLVKVTGGVQVTENVTPTTGSGMEIFKPDSTTGQIQAYDRSGNTWMDLVIKGNTQQFHANGSERLRIDSSGRLLLGTTTEGASSGDNLTIADSGHAGMTIRSGSNHTGSIYFSDATSGGGEYDGEIAYNQTSRFMKFGTAQTEQMRIDSSGNVGIGTTSPLGILHTSGNSANLVGAFLENRADAGSSDSVSLNFVLRRAGGVQFGIPAIKAVKENTWTTTASTINNSLTFSTIGNESSSERMRIDSSGNVGIGTTSPDSLLDLEFANSRMRFEQESGSNRPVIRGTRTSDKANRAISIGGSDISFLIGSTSTAALTSADEKVRIDSSGRVGIGNTAPSAKLQIEDTSDQLKLT